MTDTEARKLTAHLAVLFDVPAWTKERLLAFSDAIRDLDHAAATRAVERYMRTHHERPQPSDLRTLVAQEGCGLLGPESAWGELHAAIQSHAEQPTLHVAITDALRLTGRTWQALRLLQFDQYQWLRRDFLSAYREVSERELLTTQTSVGALPPTRAEAHAVLTDLADKVPEVATLTRGAGRDAVRAAIVDVQAATAQAVVPPDPDALKRRRAFLHRQAIALGVADQSQGTAQGTNARDIS